MRPGTVCLVDLGEPIGHEQGWLRPAVVLATPFYLSLPIGMTIVVPLTGRGRGLRTQPRVSSTGSGLTTLPSYARPEDIRAVSRDRVDRVLGEVTADELQAITDVLRRFVYLGEAR